jgi:hypothetical protein
VYCSVNLPLRIAGQRDCFVQIVSLGSQYLQTILIRHPHGSRINLIDQSLHAILYAQEYRNKFFHAIPPIEETSLAHCLEVDAQSHCGAALHQILNPASA